MSHAKRTIIEAPAIALRGHDIDTDRIIPARFLKCVVFEGLGEHVFEDDRRQERGRPGPHPFDDPRYAEARILLVGRNFGCGSSREHAPQAIMRWGRGIQAIVGESFAEIFFGNCVANGIPCVTADERAMAALMERAELEPGMPFQLDLASMRIVAGNLVFPVVMPGGARSQLMEGRWDTTGELLEGKDATAAVAAKLPYFRGWV
ncbi:MAG TPA: 3-isopropylmalate dehydratase small subunit [Candidatus Eisenbacteria bacterium]|nr:3-isopropylmalate dehydratase small subunit [Candidatus Eisenbacteria bacterium]